MKEVTATYYVNTRYEDVFPGRGPGAPLRACWLVDGPYQGYRLLEWEGVANALGRYATAAEARAEGRRIVFARIVQLRAAVEVAEACLASLAEPTEVGGSVAAAG